MSKVIVSIPMDRCVKNFLDTALYQELKRVHEITIISYLSDQPNFQDVYGGDDVDFYPSIRIRKGLRWRVYNLSELIRLFGFFFRWRNKGLSHHWIGKTKYKHTEDYVPRDKYRPRMLRYYLLSVLGFMGSNLSAHKLINCVLGNWIYSNPQLDDFFQRERPKTYIATANRTDQEKILSHHARKYGLNTILIPDSWDNFIPDGFLFHEFDRFCLWGPRQRDQIKKYHDVPDHKLIEIGVPLYRQFEQLLEDNQTFSIRHRNDIPADSRMILYLQQAKTHNFDELEIIDYICARIDDGTIPNCVLLIRTQPGQDPTSIEMRFNHRSNVRVQISGNKHSGGEGDIDLINNIENLEYIKTLRESAVVISPISKCILESYLVETPVIVNLVELSNYPEGGLSPRSHAAGDLMDLFKDGCPSVRTLEELVLMINSYLANPEKDKDTRTRILNSWDCKDESYIEHFLELIGADEETGPRP